MTAPVTQYKEGIIYESNTPDVFTLDNKYQPREKNLRHHIDKLKENWDWGQFDPIDVFEKFGKLYVVAGFHRTNALKELWKENDSRVIGHQIPFRVHSQDRAEKIAIVTNTNRRGFSPLEMAQLVKMLVNQGQGDKEIANELNMSVSNVRDMQALNNLTEETRELVRIGAIDLDKAILIGKANLDPKSENYYVTNIENFTKTQLKHALSTAKGMNIQVDLVGDLFSSSATKTISSGDIMLEFRKVKNRANQYKTQIQKIIQAVSDDTVKLPLSVHGRLQGALQYYEKIIKHLDYLFPVLTNQIKKPPAEIDVKLLEQMNKRLNEEIGKTKGNLKEQNIDNILNKFPAIDIAGKKVSQSKCEKELSKVLEQILKKNKGKHNVKKFIDTLQLELFKPSEQLKIKSNPRKRKEYWQDQIELLFPELKSKIRKNSGQGFGKDLEPYEYSGRIYHSTDLNGLANLIQNLVEEGDISFSTDDADRLLPRSVVLVLKGNFEGLYCSYDADSGKSMGWDEFRIKFKNWEQIEKKLEGIVVNAYDYIYLDAANDPDYVEIDEDREWLYWNIFESYPIYDVESANKEFNKTAFFWGFNGKSNPKNKIIDTQTQELFSVTPTKEKTVKKELIISFQMPKNMDKYKDWHKNINKIDVLLREVRVENKDILIKFKNQLEFDLQYFDDLLDKPITVSQRKEIVANRFIVYDLLQEVEHIINYDSLYPRFTKDDYSKFVGNVFDNLKEITSNINNVENIEFDNRRYEDVYDYILNQLNLLTDYINLWKDRVKGRKYLYTPKQYGAIESVLRQLKPLYGIVWNKYKQFYNKQKRNPELNIKKELNKLLLLIKDSLSYFNQKSNPSIITLPKKVIPTALQKRHVTTGDMFRRDKTNVRKNAVIDVEDNFKVIANELEKINIDRFYENPVKELNRILNRFGVIVKKVKSTEPNKILTRGGHYDIEIDRIVVRFEGDLRKLNSYSIKHIFIPKILNIIKHELIHRNQYYRIKNLRKFLIEQSYKSSSYELGKIDYYADKFEIMAYAYVSAKQILYTYPNIDVLLKDLQQQFYDKKPHKQLFDEWSLLSSDFKVYYNYYKKYPVKFKKEWQLFLKYLYAYFKDFEKKEEENRKYWDKIISNEQIEKNPSKLLKKFYVKDLEETKNYYRLRIHNPKLFVRGSFRWSPLSERQDIFAIFARPQKQKKVKIQALAFPKSKWKTKGNIINWLNNSRFAEKPIKLKGNPQMPSNLTNELFTSLEYFGEEAKAISEKQIGIKQINDWIKEIKDQIKDLKSMANKGLITKNDISVIVRELENKLKRLSDQMNASQYGSIALLLNQMKTIIPIRKRQQSIVDLPLFGGKLETENPKYIRDTDEVSIYDNNRFPALKKINPDVRPKLINIYEEFYQMPVRGEAIIYMPAMSTVLVRLGLVEEIWYISDKFYDGKIEYYHDYNKGAMKRHKYQSGYQPMLLTDVQGRNLYIFGNQSVNERGIVNKKQFKPNNVPTLQKKQIQSVDTNMNVNVNEFKKAKSLYKKFFGFDYKNIGIIATKGIAEGFVRLGVATRLVYISNPDGELKRLTHNFNNSFAPLIMLDDKKDMLALRYNFKITDRGIENSKEKKPRPFLVPK